MYDERYFCYKKSVMSCIVIIFVTLTWVSRTAVAFYPSLTLDTHSTFVPLVPSGEGDESLKGQNQLENHTWYEHVNETSLHQTTNAYMNESHDSNSPEHLNIDQLWVTKRDGRMERFQRNKLELHLNNLAQGLNHQFVSISLLVDTILKGCYPNITTFDLVSLASETAASMSTQHPDYARLAGRICISDNHKNTPSRFSDAMSILYEEGRGFIHPDLAHIVQQYSSLIDAKIDHDRDFDLTYFGFKTLLRSYLLQSQLWNPILSDLSEAHAQLESKHGQKTFVVERPQYMFMRVALGIHTSKPQVGDDEANLLAAFETYDLMSRGYFTHASPTLFHSGTIHPQLSSCFLVQMSDDSIEGIYDTLKKCAIISKSAGGIGLSVHNIRGRGTHIKGTRGVSNGLVPMLRVYDVTSRYVDQGGGKRPGAFAIYLEPWHADIFDVLNLKKNHGKEEQRARDLFYGLWVPDLFMKRVQDDGLWSLMCPHNCQGLAECYGESFERLYQQYESEGRFVRQVRARELWGAIVLAQIESGTPYMLYKDAANSKSNQQNLGTIQCSNLCTEIIQYTNTTEVAVCNLASICLAKFVVSQRGPYGSTDPSTGKAYFDHGELHRVTKIVTRNLNKIIDTNLYPVPGAKVSNLRHRPIGIGVSGLADTFIRLGLPFTSDIAKQLNEAIFETIYHAALEASVELAEEQGPYDSFSGSPASRGTLQFNLWGATDDSTPSHRFARSHSKTRNSLDLVQRYPDEVRDTGYQWAVLRSNVVSKGIRNSLLIAPMPTASTSQILGVNECFEPFASNLYLRRVKAGEFIMMNPHLLQDLTDRNLWNPTVRNLLMRDGGSVSKIDVIPDRIKELYKTVWEMKMKDIIDMAADRGKFIDQSQSLNLFVADPTVDKLTAMHFYAWKKGLKTGMYYLRTKAAVNAIQYTVENNATSSSLQFKEPLMVPVDDTICLSCSS